MAGQPNRSGGHNKLSPAEHVVRGNFRASRHAGRTTPPPVPIDATTRRRALHGLPRAARALAGEILDRCGNWDAASLSVLRSYALSAARLHALEQATPADTSAIFRETRHYLRLATALRLEARRIGPEPSAPPNPFARNLCPRDPESD